MKSVSFGVGARACVNENKVLQYFRRLHIYKRVVNDFHLV